MLCIEVKIYGICLLLIMELFAKCCDCPIDSVKMHFSMNNSLHLCEYNAFEIDLCHSQRIHSMKMYIYIHSITFATNSYDLEFFRTGTYRTRLVNISAAVMVLFNFCENHLQPVIKFHLMQFVSPSRIDVSM